MLIAPTVVFRLSLAIGDSSLALRRKLLSKDELTKADRFVVSQPRIQYIACRSALRVLLSRELGCLPSEVEFEYQRYGKPQLAQGGQRGNGSPNSLHFNVSHSGDWGLVAISQAPCGVDIEKLQPRINAKSLMSQVVSSREVLSWKELGAAKHAEQILRLWVCKEALLKAMGLGIAECLQQVDFQLPISDSLACAPGYIDPNVQLHLEESGDCRLNSWVIPKSWHLQPLTVHEDYFAAVVTSNNCSTIRLEDLDESLFR
jgi:4'-phosphopantetheinyl transferase